MDKKDGFDKTNDLSDWINANSLDQSEENRQETDKIYTREELNEELNRDRKEKEDKREEDKKDYFRPDLEKLISEEVKKQNKKKPMRVIALILVGAILGSFLGMGLGYKITRDEIAKNPKIIQEGSNISINTTEEMNVENAVAVKATPSVVGIAVDVHGYGGFFGMERVEGQNIGSGIIVSEDGHILTNAHVLSGGDEDGINVLFHDNNIAQATLLWKDETLDLAIIKVNKKGLQKVEMADSDSVKVGDKAIAIGNPVGLNLQSTLTSGYISGINRSIKLKDGQIMDGLFQTDASINSGNSGGALLNKHGQLIGINTAKIQSTDGIGFAIPANVARNIIDQVVRTGSYSPTYIGIKGINLDIYKQYYADEKIDVEDGVLVTEVIKGSTADQANIQAGDIIVGVGDKKVESMNKLKQVLLDYNTGDKSQLTIIRNNNEMKIDVTFIGEKMDV